MTLIRNLDTLLRFTSWPPSAKMRLAYGLDVPSGKVSRFLHISLSYKLSQLRHSSHSQHTRNHSRLVRMTSSGHKNQTWHFSHGIVFARNGPVVYPRLPLAKHYHSSPDLLSPTDEAADLASRELNAEAALLARVNIKERAKSVPPTGAETSNGNVLETGVADEGVLLAKKEADDIPPFNPLDFRIPDDVYRDAKLAESGTPESFWSYNLYRGPGDDGLIDAKVKVHYCKSKHTTERVLQQYFMNENLLGFDLEWAPDANKFQGTRRNVSLVQIASQSRIALFHIALFPKSDDTLVAPNFKKMMENPEVTKVGVCIKGDCTRLRNFMGIQSRGIFELSHLYKLVKHSTTREFSAINRRTVNLAAQVQEWLGLPMFKGQDVRASDWSQPLGMQQIIYSASDAYAGVQLYATMNHHRKQLKPTPPLPYHAELNRPIRLADGVVIPTANEAVEAMETAEPGDKEVQPATFSLSARYLLSLGENINIEPDGEPILKETSFAPQITEKATKDARIVAAENWLVGYRASHPAVKAPGAAMRAYRIWHSDQDLDPERLAKLLRTPPLQTATVVNYILEAIRLEKLPYEAARLKTEVLSLFPEVLASRYKPLAKACEQAITAAMSLKLSRQ